MYFKHAVAYGTPIGSCLDKGKIYPHSLRPDSNQPVDGYCIIGRGDFRYNWTKKTSAVRTAIFLDGEEEFTEYAENAKSLPPATKDADKLVLYGLYKQATNGPVNISK
ncbi:hypothetical protein LguiB_027458 [Lonicera macranthoides]